VLGAKYSNCAADTLIPYMLPALSSQILNFAFAGVAAVLE